MNPILKYRAIGVTVKPWYVARWETVEPDVETVYNDEETCYDEPTVNDMIDLEMGRDYYAS
ncbi:hypothetical protein MM02_00086 [Escherichia phage vB_EcoM_MM02]|uniref:Uncharacterized protein n=1 Tax=Escherichia phage vB_EcoM_MM02 TaxID=2508202 RepID=A0A482MZK0_9CAUD|nr:hypothetical protein MM02_00086 [Escherichia phage vB_EcoM_MM02]